MVLGDAVRMVARWSVREDPLRLDPATRDHADLRALER